MDIFENSQQFLKNKFATLDFGSGAAITSVFLNNKFSHNRFQNDNSILQLILPQSYDGIKFLLLFTVRGITFNKKYRISCDFYFYDLSGLLKNKNEYGTYHFVFDYLFGSQISCIRFLDISSILKYINFIEYYNCNFGLGGYLSSFYIYVIEGFNKKLPIIFGPCICLNFCFYQFFFDLNIMINLSYFLLPYVNIICSEKNTEFFSNSLKIDNFTNVVYGPISSTLVMGISYVIIDQIDIDSLNHYLSDA